MIAVYFTDTGKADVRQFVANPDARKALVTGIAQNLSFFPARHRPCPADLGFGPAARFYHHSGFTVIYDLVSHEATETQEIWVRHVWPAASLKAACLFP
jgi:hypothetical protein